MPRTLAVKLTCGTESAERANQGLTVAASAVALGAPVSLWLIGEAVWFAVRDRQPDLGLEHAVPLADLVESVRAGADITVCSQCAARRSVTEQDLIDGARIAGAAVFAELVLQDGVQALVY
ncbi:MAG: DsrE family protein [Nocardioides sp.]|uniref:DsrE family protein n=1 Tax=Nocardioides sp. TaxID=35761 RepID=UPI0023A12322|nr:DsrE family protein [Nocardioides sp.]MDE0776830.1 DsrE family protein [Nocardioides sp.]